MQMLIQQWLKEKGYTEALRALQQESGVVSGDAETGGLLLSILYEHQEMKAALADDGVDLLAGEKRAAEEDLLALPTEVSVPSTAGPVLSHLHGGNIIACRFSCDGLLLATGASDTSVKILSTATQTVQRTITTHGAPVLSLAFHPLLSSLLISTAMDGSTAISDASSGEVLQTFKDHTKYVTRGQWSRDGEVMATCGHDKTVVVYKKTGDDGAALPSFELSKRHQFTNIPEAMCFLDDGMTLAVSVRGDNYLHYVDVSDGSVTKANLNQMGDDHVSFTVLDLNLSPNGKFLLASTDKSRLLLYSVGTTLQLRFYYGAVNDDLCQTRTSWHPSGSYIFVTSQDHKVYCWHVTSQRLHCQLKGHSAAVRDIDMSPDGSTLVSCAFDKTVRLWTLPKDE